MDRLLNYLPDRQKMTNVALQRSDVKRAEFIAEMMQFNTDMFMFVDQTGSDRRNCIRKFGYGLKCILPTCKLQSVFLW